MLELPHAMVGAALAVAISNPAIALPAALASHFITDYVPHWNPHLHTEKIEYGKFSATSYVVIIIDSVLALILGFYIATTHPAKFFVILAACFLAVLPDVVEIPYYFFNMHINWVEKLIAYQRSHQWNVPPVIGIACQLAVVAVSFYFIRSA